MANKKGLADWALGNARQLNLKVTRVAGTPKWFTNYYDYKCDVTINETVHKGRGVDTNEETAFAKAVAECLERAAMRGTKKPWGTGAYPDYSGAKKRAYYELLGIDRVLSHHFCGMRFGAVDPEILEPRIDTGHLTSQLGRHDLRFQICELRAAKDTKIAICIIWSDSCNRVPGFVAGFGSAETLAGAAAHAVLECTRTAMAIFLSEVKPEAWELIAHPGNPRWHFWQAQTKAGMRHLVEKLLPVPEYALPEPEAVTISDIKFTPIETLKPIFPELPLSIAHAKSNRLLEPQFGPAVVDEKALERLERFAGREVSPEIIRPHFYG